MSGVDSGIPALTPPSRGLKRPDSGIQALTPPPSRTYLQKPGPEVPKEEKDRKSIDKEEVDQEIGLAAQGRYDTQDDTESSDIIKDGDYFTKRKKIALGILLLIVVIVAVVVAVVVARSGSDETPTTSGKETSGTATPGTPGTNVSDTDFEETVAPTISPGFFVPNSVTSLDENLLGLSVTAVGLCVDVNENNTEELQPTAAVFTDEPDKSMVVQVENLCFGVFRATSPRVDDWLQNLDMRPARDVCSNLTGECCTSYAGFRNGYTTSFQAEFEDALHQCKEDCPECEVILTGTSQGAAVAHVAAVYLDDLNPAIISFGQPQAIEAPCNPIDRSRMFRYINTIVVDDQLLYDGVPFLPTILGNPVHMGHLIVLGEDTQNLAYFSDAEAPVIGFGDIALKNIADAHSLVNYRARLETMWNSSTLPVSISGFAIGEKCTRGSECVAPQICGLGVCTEGAKSDPCRRNEDCLSGDCIEAACTNGEPDSGTFFVPSKITELDSDLLSLSLQAVNFSVALSANDTETLLPDASVFIDEPDEALVVKRNNTCFGVFRGTTPRFDDWAQNLNPNTAMDVCSTNGECCTTRAGFRDAYVDTTYRVDFEAAIRRCVEECPECEVVFTGASQGGAVALIAAIFLDDLRPKLLTHGQPPAVEAPCNVIDTSRYYRFVNTVVRNGDLRFDPVPFLHDAFGNTDDFGHMIILGEDTENVVYYPDGSEYPQVGLADFAVQSLLEAHLPFRYRDRLLGIATNGSFPLQIGGWAISQKCTLGSQCVPPNICGDGQCTEGAVDDPCLTDDDCLFGTCAFFGSRCVRSEQP